MSFREFLGWKHYGVIIGWTLLGVVSQPGLYDNIASLLGGVVGFPIFLLGCIYIYYSITQKTNDPEASA